MHDIVLPDCSIAGVSTIKFQYDIVAIKKLNWAKKYFGRIRHTNYTALGQLCIQAGKVYMSAHKNNNNQMNVNLCDCPK